MRVDILMVVLNANLHLSLPELIGAGGRDRG
jgi:hypothetical protein